MQLSKITYYYNNFSEQSQRKRLNRNNRDLIELSYTLHSFIEKLNIRTKFRGNHSKYYHEKQYETISQYLSNVFAVKTFEKGIVTKAFGVKG